MFDATHPEVIAAMQAALDEDIGPGDITTLCTVPESLLAEGGFFARQPLILAGMELLPTLYALRGKLLRIELKAASGDAVAAGQCVAEVSGSARLLLECERTALNFLQRLSGIATLAKQYSDAVRHTSCRILDTRKTTPGLRRLEKMAAAAGGAVNHRMGLYDAVLIKNNHVTVAGGVRNAISRARASGHEMEVEVRTKEELHEALDAGASRLLLDNLTPAEAKVWIGEIAGRATVELSGGITLETVAAYAETGADFISVGALTHSATAVDLNFRMRIL